MGLPRVQGEGREHSPEPGHGQPMWGRDSGWGWAGPCGKLLNGLLSPNPGGARPPPQVI